MPCVMMVDSASKIKACRNALISWNKSYFDHVQHDIRQKDEQLGKCFELAREGDFVAEITGFP